MSFILIPGKYSKHKTLLVLKSQNTLGIKISESSINCCLNLAAY